MKPFRTRTFVRAAGILSAAAASILAPSQALAAERLIVGYEPGVTVEQQATKLRAAGARSATARSVRSARIRGIGASTVTVPSGEAARTARALRGMPGVRYVEVDAKASISWTPNDPQLAQQWSLAKVGATRAWDTTRGAGVTIAVVDTGVSYIHPDLSGRVDAGWDFVSNDADPMDEQGHGTHVAGISSAIANNGTGIAGLAPESRVLAVRVLDRNGSGYYSWIANGITWAADNGAQVINLSLGGDSGSTALREAVEYAVAKGAVVTCATGNDGRGSLSYPAAYPACFAVGATNSSDGRASFSNYGSNIDVTAPGHQVLSAVRGGGYESWSGTSMATPYVSGLAALLASQGLSRAQIESTMKSTARDLGAAGHDNQFGAGRIDAAAAVAAAAGVPLREYDAQAPSITGIEVGGVYTVARRSSKLVWRKTRVTRWRVVGRSGSYGVYSWSTQKTVGNKRRVFQYRARGGIVRRRTVKLKRVRVWKTTHMKHRRVTVAAADNIAVDRVGLQVNGRWHGTRWNGTNGWTFAWRCRTGTHRFTAHAFDARDNASKASVDRTISC